MSRTTGALILVFVAMLLGTATGITTPARAAPANAVYLPNVTKTLGGPGGWTTPVAIQNVGAASTTVGLSLYRFSDGASVATLQSPSLQPGQAWTFDPLVYPALPADSQFSLVLDPGAGQVTAVVIEGSGASWMAYGGTATGASTVYLPNITRRLGGPDGWSTPFIVQNIGEKPVTASVSFYEFASGALTRRIDGVTLQPGRSQSFLPWAIDGLADGGQWAVVVQGPSDALLYAIVNEHQAAQAMSYEGLFGGEETVYLPNVVKFLGGEGGWSTPFIVQNLGASATTLSLSFYAFGSKPCRPAWPASGSTRVAAAPWTSGSSPPPWLRVSTRSSSVGPPALGWVLSSTRWS